MRYGFGFLLIALVGYAQTCEAAGKSAEKDVACKTCMDTGKVEESCPTCHGSKYIWECKVKSNVRRYSDCWYDDRGRYHQGTLEEGVCGYGAIYKPIHVDCKNSRTRRNCPDCLSKAGKRSTGKITVPCPDCDAGGNLQREYFLVKDIDRLAANRDYVLRCIARGDDASYSYYIVRRKLNKEQLTDFKMEYPNCREFKTLSDVKKFVEDGCVDTNAEEKWYFVIYNVNEVSSFEQRETLRRLDESSQSSYFSSPSSNLSKRKLSDEEAKDFAVVNPNGKLFRSLEEFKLFLRDFKPDEGVAATVYYIVRDADRVTLADKRLALEQIIGCNYTSYHGGNIIKQAYDDEGIADFKALNPKCKVFTDSSEFRKFIREVRVYESSTPARESVPAVFEPASQAAPTESARGRRSSRRRMRGGDGKTPVSDAGVSEADAAALIKAEYEHDEEMRVKKFEK